MLQENYLEYLEKTIELYPDKLKRYLVKRFIQKGIATKEVDTSGQLCLDGMDMVDISEKALTEQLVPCIRQSKRACFFIEKWEFIKDYKYSVLFTCDDFAKILERVKKISPLNECYENEYLYTSFGDQRDTIF